ncbi:MAG TPA: CocE/NonD family hydrolase [Vicinamibacteria bacterium]|nr:CocE/NonD family hydrolase [Vicinamibacteria bacterium]
MTLGLTASLAALPAAAKPSLGEHHVTVESGVRVPMRDGVALVADVYRPTADGRFPVLLQRTPYNRADPGTGVLLASHGYVVVLQDTRGRFASEGQFYPFRDEARDGYDTVEWAAALPYADGRVGMFGGSYVGATQMLAASVRPPHLVAIFPYVTASEYYEGWTYQSGALMQWFASTWSSGLAVDTLRRSAAARSRPRDWVEPLPVETFRLLDPPPVAELEPYFRDWVAHERSDEYWRPVRVKDRYGSMAVKGLHGGGWHDLFLKGSIENYLGLRDQAATPEARAAQRLVLGPWCHGPTSEEGKIGDVVFGKDAVLDLETTLLEWSDYTLKDRANRWASGAPVRLFVMGENRWRDEQDFPLARTNYTRYYLRSRKAPNTAAGDGVLSLEPPGREPAATFEYDPQNPVRTIGGRLCCGAATTPGPYDQRPNESRPDVLVFSTPPLAKDVEVTGYVRLELFAASSAVDTDFTALLADVDPSGYARFLTDGIVRGRYRESTERASLLDPGRPYKLEVDLWATSNLFKAGHRIRLYVSSSNFPRFDRNLNTGEPILGASRVVKARQTVYHEATRPSALVLPVIPR